jgi:hypothetical protein
VVVDPLMTVDLLLVVYKRSPHVPQLRVAPGQIFGLCLM